MSITMNKGRMGETKLGKKQRKKIHYIPNIIPFLQTSSKFEWNQI